MHLDNAFSEDEIEKNILNILVHLSRIFNDNPRFLNYGNGFMHTLNEMGTQKVSSLHTFYKDPKEMGCPITLHLTFKPWRLIEKFITIQSGQSGSLLTNSVLDGESFHFDDDSWEQRGDKLEMIWSWEREEIFVELQLLATKLIEITVGPVSP